MQGFPFEIRRERKCQSYFGGVLFSVVYNMTAGILNAAGNSRRSLIYLAWASPSDKIVEYSGQEQAPVIVKTGLRMVDEGTNHFIGENCIIGAGALVTQNTNIPAGSLAFGNPAKVIRSLTREEIESNQQNARHYIAAAETQLK